MEEPLQKVVFNLHQEENWGVTSRAIEVKAKANLI
jgi:hypothetical protein